jgi:hypothetical protein
MAKFWYTTNALISSQLLNALEEAYCNRDKMQHEYTDKKHCLNNIIDSGSPWDNVKFDNNGESIDLCE